LKHHQWADLRHESREDLKKEWMNNVIDSIKNGVERTRDTKMKIKLSKTDWKSIGQKMGWIKIAQPEDNSDEESSDFSYLTELEPGDEILKRLRNKAEDLLGMGNTPEDLHKALYWVMHDDNNHLHKSTRNLIPYVPQSWQYLGHMSEDIRSLAQAFRRALKPQ